MICAAEHELVPDVETALRRRAGLLRPAARHATGPPSPSMVGS